MDLTEQQRFYEYTDDPASWHSKTPPEAPDWFQAELTLFAGVSDKGQPNLRVSWAATLLHDITEKPQLKYKAVREVNVGYFYKKQDGGIGTTKSMNLPDDAQVPWEFWPKTQVVELGRLRWVIEKHIPAWKLREQKRFENRRAANGELILRELPPEGIYEHFFWVQTAAHKFRDLDAQVLEAVKAMWQFNVKEWEAWATLDRIEEENSRTLVGAEEAREIWKQL